ncbi:GntR family transcriptional regulator, partial [Amycolatopsis sulphurea]
MTRDYRPAYQRVLDDLQERIAAGDLKPGDMVPSEGELAEEHGISRGSV